MEELYGERAAQPNLYGNLYARGPIGPIGPQGPTGDDGVSPSVTIVAIEGGHRVTITDAEGDHTFDVMDGAGDMLSSIYDDELAVANAGGIAQYIDGKGFATETAVSAKYTKPSDGIPKDDLTSAVQTSLGLADTAIQPASLNNYYTKGTIDGFISTIGAAVGRKYEKPSTGIPKTDLASAVQTSLGLADTALQEHQSLSNYYKKSETYSDDEVDALLDDKADKSTTYTKTETDSALALKADASSVYTKTEADEALADKADADDVTEALALKADSADVEEALENKANIDGYYATLGVGVADNLVGRGTVTEHFTYQTSGGSADIGSGRAEIKSIKGNTIVWNQLINKNNLPQTQTLNGITFTNNADGTITVDGTATGGYAYISATVRGIIGGHKYLWRSTPVGGSNTTFYSYLAGTAFRSVADVGNGVIETASGSGSAYPVFAMVKEGVTVSNLVFKPQLFDLTQMFGAGNEPSTVDEFKALFPLDYYAYNEGEIISLNATGLKTNGFNQLKLTGRTEVSESREPSTTYNDIDQNVYYKGMAANGYLNTTNVESCTIEENSIKVKTSTAASSASYGVGFPMRVLPNTTYNIHCNGSAGDACITYFDSDKKIISYQVKSRNATFTTPNNAFYATVIFRPGQINTEITLTDICVNISWSGVRNGDYEPYWDSILSLPIADYFEDGMKSAGTAYDELTPNKAVKRMGEVDLGSLTWSRMEMPSGSGLYVFYSNELEDTKIYSSDTSARNIIAPKYTVPSNFSRIRARTASDNNLISVQTNSGRIRIVDDSYTTAQALKESLNGVYMCYELATPIETPINPPLELSYRVDDFGTEMLLPQNDDEPVTSPIICDVKYAMNAVDTLRNLDKNYQNQDSMGALLSALGTALGFTYTKTWDATNKKYNYTITMNS